MPQTAAFAAHADRGKSWMKSGTSGQDLLYLADSGGNGVVFVYSFPGLSLVGELQNGNQPFGECVDASGNMYIVDETEVVEYAHGGTEPIRAIPNPGSIYSYLRSCAIDPSTGDLAVVAQGYYAGVVGQGSNSSVVFVYPRGSGTPTEYSNVFPEAGYCGYDDHGHLFVVGSKYYYSAATVLEELRRRRQGFSQIEFRGDAFVVDSSAGVQWNHGKLALVGYRNHIPRILRFELRGRHHDHAVAVGHTVLSGVTRGGQLGQFWIQGNRIVVPRAYPGYDGDFFVFRYPSGALLTELPGYGEPTAAAVSVAAYH